MDFYNSRYFKINQRMLKFLGLWPFQNRKTKFLIRTFLMLIMCTAMIPQVIYILSTIITYLPLRARLSGVISLVKYSKVDADKVIQGAATMFFILGIFLKLITTIATERKIQIVYQNIVQNWKLLDDKDEIRTLVEYSETGRLLTIGYIGYMFMALIMFITMPMIPMAIDIILPINGSRPRIFILDGEYILDKYEHYGKVYIFESWTCIMLVVIFSTVDATYAVCVEQCVGLMAVVRLRLQLATCATKIKSIDSEEKDIPYELISRSAQLHQKVINFANVLESSYAVNFLFLMGANVMVLSIGSVVIIMNLDRPMELIRYTLIFIGLMIHMFYLSWPGQKLSDSSGGILYDAYNNEWYECSQKTKKLLKFMMLRCIEPCQLTAGGIYVMNVANFGALVKTSLSYMAVFASFR